MSRYYDYLRTLREWHPTKYPVWVRRCLLTGIYGSTQLLDEPYTHFLITLNSSLKEPDLLHTLLHEWAHAVSWDLEEEEDHGEEWSLAYGRIYQDFVEA